MTSPVNQYICQKMEQMHQGWEVRDCKEIDREWRQQKWRGWALLGMDIYGVVVLGGLT